MSFLSYLTRSWRSLNTGIEFEWPEADPTCSLRLFPWSHISPPRNTFPAWSCRGRLVPRETQTVRFWRGVHLPRLTSTSHFVPSARSFDRLSLFVSDLENSACRSRQRFRSYAWKKTNFSKSRVYLEKVSAVYHVLSAQFQRAVQQIGRRFDRVGGWLKQSDDICRVRGVQIKRCDQKHQGNDSRGNAIRLVRISWNESG